MYQPRIGSYAVYEPNEEGWQIWEKRVRPPRGDTPQADIGSSEQTQALHVHHRKRWAKKLVSIAPWYRDGEYAGFALIVLDLPERLPNINKDR